MAAPVRILPHYTYEEYVLWEGQWELIGGIPYAMSPAPVPSHQRIGGNIFSEFRLDLKKCSHCTVYQPIDYKISDDTILQPDMLVVCGAILKKYLDFAPALVVEILSPSTALKDRHTKFALYESQQIKYYLLVSAEKEEVEVYELEGGVYQLKQQGKDFTWSFSFDQDCSAAVDFSQVW